MRLSVEEIYPRVSAYLEESPILSSLPDIASIVRIKETLAGGGTWALPILGCHSVEGDSEASFPAVAAHICLLKGAHLADAVMDGDEIDLIDHPNKEGLAANYAVMLVGAAHQFVDEAFADDGLRAQAHAELASAITELSIGQHKKLFVGRSEEKYWEAITQGSAAFFGHALYLGALISGNPAIARRLKALGGPLARYIQIGDDIRDAFANNATTDWRDDQVNLAILYGLVADYPEKARFMNRYPRVHEDPQALMEARDILARSGALAYCHYKQLETYKEIVTAVEAIELPDPEPIWAFVDSAVGPLLAHLKDNGYDADKLLALAG